MIIEMLIGIVYSVFDVLTMPIDIPDLPSEIYTYVDTLVEYVGTGIGILSNYCHISYLLILFFIVVAVDVGLWLYNVVIWVLKKIPSLGIE